MKKILFTLISVAFISSFSSAQLIKKGIKGFIYGDRGVWRPGDSLFINLILDDQANHAISLISGHVGGANALTKKIAGILMLKHWDQIKQKGLIVGLDGPLGAGKTIFAKGVGKFLQISDIITSPTYSYIEEYDYQRHDISGKLYHIDLWKIETEEELKRLEIEKLIAPKNVVVIEWWDQGRKYLEKITDLKILIEEKGEQTRKIT